MGAIVAADGRRVGVSREVIDELLDIPVRGWGRIRRTIDILDGGYRFDGIGPINGQPVNVRRGKVAQRFW